MKGVLRAQPHLLPVFAFKIKQHSLELSGRVRGRVWSSALALNRLGDEGKELGRGHGDVGVANSSHGAMPVVAVARKPESVEVHRPAASAVILDVAHPAVLKPRVVDITEILVCPAHREDGCVRRALW